MKLTFSPITTSQDDFFGWLGRYLKRNPWPEYYTLRGAHWLNWLAIGASGEWEPVGYITAHSLDAERIELEVTFADDAMPQGLESLLDAIRRTWPEARTAADATIKRRRGPVTRKETEQRETCLRWLKVQGTTTQSDFCNTEGISPTTLRRWLKDSETP